MYPQSVCGWEGHRHPTHRVPTLEADLASRLYVGGMCMHPSTRRRIDHIRDALLDTTRHTLDTPYAGLDTLKLETRQSDHSIFHSFTLTTAPT